MEKIVKKIEDIENPIDNIFKDNVDKKKRSILHKIHQHMLNMYVLLENV